MDLVDATAHTVCMLRLVFCKADIINHYFCDLYPVLEVACSSSFINDIVGLCLCAFNIIVPCLTILGSYIFVIASIIRIHSAEGRSKASAPAAPTSQLLPFSMVLQHSCTCSHHHWTPWTKGKCPLYFTPLLYQCRNPNSVLNSLEKRKVCLNPRHLKKN
jgi:hypothetical protein